MLCTFFAVGYTSQKFRLPSVLIYIVLGSAVSSLLLESKLIHIAAEIGIVLLFFILGLEFPLARMISISKKIWPAGLLDIVLNLGGAMGVSMVFGLDIIGAFMIGAIAYTTSSSISAKMLDEKKRLASPETEFILALLILEDLVAPILVSFISGIQSGDEISAGFMGLLFLKITGLVLGAILMGHYGFRRLGDFVGKYIETDFMPLLAAGLALGYAGVAIAMGLSEILGAFMAGVMLSETGRSPEIEHMTLPIRDITLPFFFFWFGTSIRFTQGVPFVGMMVVLVLIGVAGKILMAYFGGRVFGLSPKVSCRAGFSMVQRGEFSAIIASMALPQLRIFSGIYILITAFVGVYLFNKAPDIAKWYHNKWFRDIAPAARHLHK